MFNRRPLAAPVTKRKRRKPPQQPWAGRPSNRAESIADLVTKMKAGESNLLVVSRIRPMADAEVLMGASETAKVVGEKVVVLLDPSADIEDILRKNRSREKRYAFDHAFGPEATQVEVYESSCKFLLRGVLEGYNATVFAYGPTGAGKTFTMTGSEAHPGIMTRSISDLFRLMAEDETEVDYTVAVNYVEIYNECIRDLLVRGSPDLDLREDSDGNSVVCGVRWVEIESADQLAQLLREGNLRRTQEATRANLASSRSHAILEVRVQRTSKSAGKDHTVQTGSLHMIDLAGSERAASTGNHGQRMVEGQHINRSLLALGNCINALGTGTARYVNFRDSKLTRILKESLGGNCRTVMIACASPASIHFEETYNTMNYANRAKNIKTAAVKNTTVVEAHIVEFGQIVERLKAEVTYLQAKLKAGEAASGPRGNPASSRAMSAERSVRELSRRYDVLFALEEKFQAGLIEESSLVAAETSPSTRKRRELLDARALLTQEIEAEKASIARLTAAVEETVDNSVPQPSARHLASQHKLRVAHLMQSTELRLVKLRLAAEERSTASGIRDRVIERQRTLLGGVLPAIPEDLVEMYRELGELRSREARRNSTDEAGAAAVLPQLQLTSQDESPQSGAARGDVSPLWSEAPAPTLQDLQQVLSEDSSSEAESPEGDGEHPRPPSPLSKSISSRRSERIDGVPLGSVNTFGRSGDREVIERLARSVSASTARSARRSLRKRTTLSGRRINQDLPEDGAIEPGESRADASEGIVEDVAIQGARNLGETYSMAEFQKLISPGADDMKTAESDLGMGPENLRRTYSKANSFISSPLPPPSMPSADGVVVNQSVQESISSPTNLPDLAVVPSGVKSSNTPQVPTNPAPKRSPRAPLRGKQSPTKNRTPKTSPSPSTFGLHISSSPYAAQPRKPKGVR